MTCILFIESQCWSTYSLWQLQDLNVPPYSSKTKIKTTRHKHDYCFRPSGSGHSILGVTHSFRWFWWYNSQQKIEARMQSSTGQLLCVKQLRPSFLIHCQPGHPSRPFAKWRCTVQIQTPNFIANQGNAVFLHPSLRPRVSLSSLPLLSGGSSQSRPRDCPIKSSFVTKVKGLFPGVLLPSFSGKRLPLYDTPKIQMANNQMLSPQADILESVPAEDFGEKQKHGLRKTLSTLANDETGSRFQDTQKSHLCGSSWQEEYSKLHDDILNSRRPPRYVSGRVQPWTLLTGVQSIGQSINQSTSQSLSRSVS